MGDLEQCFLPVPWGQLSYLVRGPKEGETIMFLHGNHDTASTFFPLIKFIPAEYRLVLIELPSCGKSTSLPVGQMFQMLDFVYCVKMIVEHLQLETFTFICHSMGFQIALIYSSVYSGIVKKFIAIDNLGYPPITAEDFPSGFKYYYENFYHFDNYKIFNSGIDSNHKYTYEEALTKIMKNRRLTKEAGEIVLQRALVPVGDNLFRFTWDQRLKCVAIPIFGSKNQMEVLKAIKIPHLTIFASETTKSRLRKPEFSHIMEAYISSNPNFRMTVIEGVHDVHLNSPEKVAAHIVPFLKDNYDAIDETKKCIEHFQREQLLPKSKL